MKTTRVNEIISEFRAFERKSYSKDEILSELLKLQSETVRISKLNGFPVNEGSRILDISKCLENKNIALNHRYDYLLDNYLSSSKNLQNEIRGMISGKRGEQNTFFVLDKLSKEAKVLTNVELKNEFYRTKIDAVVITKTGVTIIEIKNTKQDIYIDENGNYYRTGDYLYFDSQLWEKLELREQILMDIIQKAGFKIPIQKIVVFTDSRINIHNECNFFKTCFLPQLNFIVNSFGNKSTIDHEGINILANIIKEMEVKEQHYATFDADTFKLNYAKLIVAIQEDRQEKFKTGFSRLIELFKAA